MKITENKNLKKYNSFGVEVFANQFVEVTSKQEIINLIKEDFFTNRKVFILGEGCNVLFTKNYDGIVLKVNSKGINKIKETSENVWIKSSAGENWNDFVYYCIEKNYFGIENLVAIPGSVGASPIQNIGAYGVEVKEFIEEVEVINLQTGEIELFSNSQCNFSYRNSVFKSKLKNKFLIVAVTFKLNKTFSLNLNYSSLKKVFNLEETLTAFKVAETIKNIRERKLPNYREVGNAGSFFKNPSISKSKYLELEKKYNSIPSFTNSDATIKIPAGWLIEKTGFKGKQENFVGCYQKQALIIVNYGTKNGEAILSFANKVRAKVNEEFGINLEFEVNIV